MKYVDVHAHMNEEIFDKDRDKIMEACNKKEILIINCSGTPEGNRNAVKMARRYKGIKLCLGIYPVQCAEMTDKEFFEELEFIKKYAPNLAGIGEVGLDFYWIKDNDKRRLQAERLRELIWIANKHRLALNVHTRDATLETIELLIKTAHVPVILHAFSGEKQAIDAGLQAGFYFSIPANVVYNKKRQALVEYVPLGKLLTETDCPYLGTEPGKRSDPRNVPNTVKQIAKIKKIKEEEVRKILLENAKTVFGINFRQ